MPIILHLQNQVAINKFEVTNKGLSFGRSVKNDIFLDDPSASQNHAKIQAKELKNGSYIYLITDLKSTNSTLVNDRAITEHLLSDQDTIEIGNNQFRYIDEDKESLAATKQYKKSWIPGVLVLK